MKRFKHFALTVLVALVSSISAYAYDVEIGGLYYNLYSSYYDSGLGKQVYGNFAFVTHDNNYVDVDPDPTNTNMQLQGGHYSGNIVIPSSIVYNEVTYQIIGVYEKAFYKCTELESVTLPESLKSIGYYAFAYCSSITSITLPESVTSIGRFAFEYCSSLTSITLLESVTSIGYGAFEYCSALTSITLPESVTSIESDAFQYCSSLTSITLPESVTSIGYYAFCGCSSLTNITLPESVTNIGYEAFRGCSSLEEIKLPESLQYISAGLFYDCSSLKTVNIPSSIISIRSSAFDRCNSLNSITIPENSSISFENKAFSGYNGLVYNLSDMEIESYSHVFTDKAELDGYVFGKKDNQWYFTEYIGENDNLILPDDFNGNHYEIYNNAKIKKTITSLDTGNGITDLPGLLFLNFSNLEEVTIGEKLQTAGVGVFAGCYNLRTLNYNVVHFENQRAAYYMEYVDEKGYRNSTYYPLEFKSILTLNIGNDVECLPKNAFQENKNLTSIALPNSIKTVNEFDFQYCTGLQEINLESVETIGEKAFYGCTGLQEINLENVKTIGSSAFYGCTGLTELTLGKNLTFVGVGTFAGCYNLRTLNYNVVHFENQRTDNDVNYYDENGNRKYTNYPLEFNSISTLNIGDEVEYIPNNTVRENKNLTTVNLADGIKAQTIGKYTFYGCSNLQSINLYKEPKEILNDEKEDSNDEETNNEENNEEDNEGTKEVLMTKGVCIKNIGEYAFYGCTGLKDINLESVETIGEKAFYGCTGLYEINLKSVETIENYAFHGCTGLKEINLENVKTIGTSAFNSCTSLTELTLDKQLTSIGVGAFAGCYNLRTLNYNVVHFENQRTDNNQYVGYYDENGHYHSTGYPLEFKSISTLNIGDEVEYIPNNMVQGNNNLMTVNLADGIKAQTIGERTFYGCSNLQSINLYEEPKEIVTDEEEDNNGEENNDEENGEEENEETKEVQMTKGVCIKNIGEYAFNGCSKLNNSLDLRGVETIGNYAFSSIQISNLNLGKNLNSVADDAFSFNAPLEKLTVSNDYGLNYMLGKKYYDYTDYRYKRVIKKLVIAEDFADEQITGNFTNQNNLETIESNTVEPLAFALVNPFTESQYSSIAVKVPEESAEKYKTAPVWKLFYVTSADCLLKLYNGNSEMQLIPQDGTERPEEATAVNAVMLVDEQLEAGNGLLAMGNVVYRNERNNWVAGEINLFDAQPFYNPVNVEAQTINYVRNFTSTNLQALYLPYAMSYDDWKDKAKVSYINDVHQFDDDDDGEIDRTVLEFISVKSGDLAPNIPYLIKPLEKGETTFTSSNKTLKATLSDGYIDCSSTRTLYTLKGTYQTRDDIYANGYYAMSGGTFKVADNAGVKLSPFRIFLSITNRYGSGSVPRAKKITIMVDGIEEDTADIDGITINGATPTASHNLQGVRVGEGYKGIVIRNGRKVLVR